MQCSSRNFLASQALYGLMIAHPKWTKAKKIKEAYGYADDMMKASVKPKVKKKRQTIIYN